MNLIRYLSSITKTSILDSLYFACSAKTLEEAVKPEKKTLFETLKSQFLAVNEDPNDPNYDYRKPGN